jgi:hypothetical protein
VKGKGSGTRGSVQRLDVVFAFVVFAFVGKCRIKVSGARACAPQGSKSWGMGPFPDRAPPRHGGASGVQAHKLGAAKNPPVYVCMW